MLKPNILFYKGIYLQSMKKKFALINLLLMITVLLSMLFQSLHSYEHLTAHFSNEKCHQKHDFSKPQITHQHNYFDKCFVCDFTLSHFDDPGLQSFSFPKVVVISEQVTIYTSQSNTYFIGSLYNLRGPPTV